MSRVAIFALSVTALAGHFGALAQEEDQGDVVVEDQIAPLPLESVVVIGTRTKRRLLDSIETVSRVDTREIERFQSTTLAEALRNIPGMEFSSSPRAVAQEPTIRGLGGQRVLVTVDGARQNFDSGHKGRVFVETDLLKAVEVQRGPGSALYGSGALGGVIAMTTKDGTDFLEAGQSLTMRLKTGYQDVNREQNGNVIFAGRTDMAGGLDILVSGTRRSSEDIELGGGEVLADSATDTWAGLTKVGWTPDDESHVRLSRQYLFTAGEVPAQADVQTSATAVLTDRETELTVDRLSYQNGDGGRRWMNLSTSLYNSQQVIREKRIGTDGRLDIIDFDTVGAEIRNTSNLEFGKMSHRLTYGVETFSDEMRASRGANPNTVFPDADSRFIGAYLQDEVDVNDKLSLVLGLRYDDFQSESSRAEQIGVARENRDSALSPRLGALYMFNDTVGATFSFSQAFRAPAFQELFISGVHFGANNFVPNADLTSEKLTSGVEVGLRVSADSVLTDDDSLNLRANYFNNQFDDFIDSIVTTTITTFVNVSEARTHGGELELDYRAFDGFSASMGLSYLLGDNETRDRPLTGIPGHNVRINLAKSFYSAGLDLGWRSVFYQRQDRVITNQPETPGYAVHDLWAIWRPSRFDGYDLAVTFGVDNVFDKNFRSHLSSLPSAGRNMKMTITGQF
ncbi:MAG: TonB-dependent hemoglobin/transferrin/lactoferrin family receptor [Pseudomonadota bacterium]